MPNFYQDESVRLHTAASDLLCGDVVLTADGLAGLVEGQAGIKSGARGHLRVKGIVEFAKASAATAIAAGSRLIYSISGKTVTVQNAGPVASTSIIVGFAAAASASGAANVLVDLNGDGPSPELYSGVRHIRQRVTTAEVNAGLTLLPAIAGYRYRLVDCAMISIGGNASGATSVNLSATQTTAVNLVANAVAGLTQHTLLRAGATNSTILNAGASFVANDANTAITVGKTGSDLATATNIDVLVSYVIEPA